MQVKSVQTVQETNLMLPKGWISLRIKLLALVLIPIISIGIIWLVLTTTVQANDSRELVLQGTIETVSSISESISGYVKNNADSSTLSFQINSLLRGIVTRFPTEIEFAAVIGDEGRPLYVFDRAFQPNDPAYPEAGLPVENTELIALWTKLKPQRAQATQAIGQFAANYQTKDLQATKSRLTQTINADSQSILLVSYPITQAGTATVLGYNLTPLQTRLNRSLWTALGVLLVTVFMTMVLVSGFTNRLIQSVLNLTNSANRISLGEMNEPLTEYPKDELGILAQAIERLRTSVEILLSRKARH